MTKRSTSYNISQFFGLDPGSRFYMSEQDKPFRAAQLAWSLGYTIALPLVIFALGGRFLDKKFDTGPWLFLAGVLLSIIVSSWAVWLKVAKIIGDKK